MVKWNQRWILGWSGYSGEDGVWGQVLLVCGSSAKEMWCRTYPPVCGGCFHLLPWSELLPLFTYDEIEREIEQQIRKWSLQTSTTSHYTSDRFKFDNNCICHYKGWNGHFGGVSKFPHYDKHWKWPSWKQNVRVRFSAGNRQTPQLQTHDSAKEFIAADIRHLTSDRQTTSEFERSRRKRRRCLWRLYGNIESWQKLFFRRILSELEIFWFHESRSSKII